jgi:hypothetical protein
MRNRLIATSFILAALILTTAGAAKADNFTYVLGGNTYTWSLPNMPTIPSGNASSNSFFIEPVSYTVDGGGQTGGTLTFFISGDGGGFELQNSSDATLLNEFGGQVFSGPAGDPTSNPTFIDNVFTLNDGSAEGPAGTLTIVGTPEPGTLALLGAGVLSLFGFRRKRALNA